MSYYWKEDSDRLFDYDIMIPERTLYVGGEVDEGMAERFLKGMLILEAKSHNPITIILNSGGGDEYHGMAIYDAIAASPCHVTVKMYGHAMSMGSWIPQAADERIMSKNATMMIHYGSWGGYEMESIHVKSMHQENQRLTKAMEDEYLRRIREKNPDFAAAKLRRWLTEEKYLTAAEAVELGLADRIIE